MKRHNIQSLAFALVVLLVTFISKSGADTLKTPTKSAIENTSLTAQVSNIAGAQEPTIPEPLKKAEPVGPLKVSEPKPIPPIKQPEPEEPVAKKIETPVKFGQTRIIEEVGPEKRRLPEPPPINAAAILIVDLNSDLIFLRNNPDQRWPLASLTKLMTAVVALENMPADQKIIISEASFNTEGDAGSLAVKDVYSVTDLVKAALVISSNDAAAVLAETYGPKEFIALMQSKAQDLEMGQTFFFDSTGLSVLNQSTVSDVQKLISYIIKKHPLIMEITARKEIIITELNSLLEKKILNNNKFAGRSGFLGGKTGYTDDARGNLASVFEINSQQLLIIVLGTADRFGETEKLLKWAESVIGK